MSPLPPALPSNHGETMIFDYDVCDREIGWWLIEMHCRKSTGQFSVQWGRKICGPDLVPPYFAAYEGVRTTNMKVYDDYQRGLYDDYEPVHEKETAKS